MIQIFCSLAKKRLRALFYYHQRNFVREFRTIQRISHSTLARAMATHCQQCGSPIDESAKFCSSCGMPVTKSADAADAFAPTDAAAPMAQATGAKKKYMEPGRGQKILQLGIAALAAAGPATGILAWKMGDKDLLKIELGIIHRREESLTKNGRLLGIIGTFVSPLSFLIYYLLLTIALGFVGDTGVASARAAMISEINAITVNALQYYNRPGERNAPAYSFKGYKLPAELAETATGEYRVRVNDQHSILVEGTFKEDPGNRITLYLGSNGKVKKWRYTGEFQEPAQ